MSNIVNETDFKTALSVEGTYTSIMRNCITLFALGLTIINLTKRRKTQKIFLSFLVMICGIGLGVIATIEYRKRIELIKNKQFNNYNLMSNTVYVTSFLVILFICIAIYKFINMNDEYNLLDVIMKVKKKK